jgi:hypothetical protein
MKTLSPPAGMLLLGFACITGSVDERNHQGLGNTLIRPEFAGFTPEGAIRCRDRLGGLLRYYYREAA